MELKCFATVISIAYLEDPEEDKFLGDRKVEAYLAMLLALPDSSIVPAILEYVQDCLILQASLQGWERTSVIIPHGVPFKEGAAAIVASNFSASAWIRHGGGDRFDGYFASIFPFSGPTLLNYWESAVNAVADGMMTLLQSTLTKESAFDKFRFAFEIFAKSVSATLSRASKVRRASAGVRHFSIFLEVLRALRYERKGSLQSWQEFFGGNYASIFGGCWDAAYQYFGNFAQASMQNGRPSAYKMLVDASVVHGRDYAKQIKEVLMEFLTEHSTEAVFTLSTRYLQVVLYQINEGVLGSTVCKPIEQRLKCVIENVNKVSYVKNVWTWWQKRSNIWQSSNWLGLGHDLDDYPEVRC